MDGTSESCEVLLHHTFFTDGTVYDSHDVVPATPEVAVSVESVESVEAGTEAMNLNIYDSRGETLPGLDLPASVPTESPTEPTMTVASDPPFGD